MLEGRANSILPTVMSRWFWVLLFMPILAFVSYAYLNFYSASTLARRKRIFNAVLILLVGLGVWLSIFFSG